MMKERDYGFTLIEFLITVVIMVVMLTVAIPSMTSALENNKVNSMANDLSFSLNFARSEAIKRGVSVSICPTLNGTYTSCGTSWNQGWMVFVNPNADGVFANSSQEALLRIHANDDKNLTITPNPSMNVVTYSSSGFAAQGTANVTFTLTSSGCTGKNARTIKVNQTGRITSTSIACQ